MNIKKIKFIAILQAMILLFAVASAQKQALTFKDAGGTAQIQQTVTTNCNSSYLTRCGIERKSV